MVFRINDGLRMEHVGADSASHLDSDSTCSSHSPDPGPGGKT